MNKWRVYFPIMMLVCLLYSKTIAVCNIFCSQMLPKFLGFHLLQMAHEENAPCHHRIVVDCSTFWSKMLPHWSVHHRLKAAQWRKMFSHHHFVDVYDSLQTKSGGEDVPRLVQKNRHKCKNCTDRPTGWAQRFFCFPPALARSVSICLDAQIGI